MKIALITYDAPHHKTEFVARKLANYKELDISFYALPFVPRKTREVLFNHRPNQFESKSSLEVAQELGEKWNKVQDISSLETKFFDYFIVLGAGILPIEFIKKTGYRVINCHPGLIPLVRGLDSFKWAIYSMLPIGNTIHFIGDEVDLGKIIVQEKTPVYMRDTLASFAARHYHMELELLSQFHLFLGRENNQLVVQEKSDFVSKRMPIEMEALLEAKFRTYKDKYSIENDF
ncbi:formyltransferase family protein [Thalassomonas sp. RHCl1]|uniref:formyltransferase family protein n=1 Tax=Thalassomonas sp. RHCl1 TaxID=2995320 RepID=UPI00248CBAAF|nr:formyltransferase family protein [Thalassomonas sp. RHCl1]